jgi:hypothetical protein
MRVAVVLLVLATLLMSIPVGVHSGSPRPTPAFPRQAEAIGAAQPALSGPASPLVPRITSSYAWSNVTVPGGPNPPARSYAAMAYDVSAAKLVLFGGLSASGAVSLGDTWTYASGTWTNLTPSLTVAPTPRSGAGMAYDPSSGGVVLFGGISSTGAFLNDTWEFSGSSWANVTPTASHSPPRLYLPSVSEDSSDRLVLLAGGDQLGGYGLSSTWTWSGGKWTNISASTGTPPSPRFDDVLANDPADSGVLLFGGFNGNTTVMNDTWLFKSGGWTNLTPTLARSPPRLLFPSLGEVGSSGALLLTEGAFVGNDFVPTLSPYTWQWSSSTWTNLTGSLAPTSPPPLRTNAASTEVTAGEYLAIFGGIGSSSSFSDLEFLHPLLGVSATLAPLLIGVNQSLDYSGTYSGGVPPITQGWVFGDGGTSGISSGSYSYTNPGVYVASYWARDSLGDVAYSNFSVTVVGHLTAQASAGPSPVDPGVLVNFTALAAGGYAPYSYVWNFTGNLGYSTEETPSFAFPTGGTFVVELEVEDSHGAVAFANVSVLVVERPQVSIVAPSAPTTGTPVSLYASFSGGVPPFTYAWSFGDGTTSTLPDPNPVYANPGSYRISLTVVDSFHIAAEANASLNVTTPPPVLSVRVTATPSSGTVSVTSFEFVARISGGYAPYAFLWSSPDGATGTGTHFNHTFASTGTFEVAVNVTDPWGQWAMGFTNVSVQEKGAPPSSSSGILGNPLEVVGVIAVVAVVALLLLLVAVRRSRRRRADRTPPPRAEKAPSTTKAPPSEVPASGPGEAGAGTPAGGD